MKVTDRKGNRSGWLLLLAAASLAACEGQPTEPVSDDAGMVMAIVSESMTMRPTTNDDGSAVEVPCPAGGRLMVEGTSTREREGELSIRRWNQILRHDECAMEARGTLVTASGEMHVYGEAQFGPPVGQHAPLVMQESRQVGQMSVTRGGNTLACSYDLAFHFDPASGRYRITGSACGNAIDMSAPATP